MDIEKVTEAINTLELEGAKVYNQEYVKGISKWSKVGMAIAHSYGSFSMNMFDLIYEIAEDWNFHNICAMIDFVFRSRSSTHYLDKLLFILPHFLNKEVECLSKNDDGTYDKKKIKVSVTIKEIE